MSLSKEETQPLISQQSNSGEKINSYGDTDVTNSGETVNSTDNSPNQKWTRYQKLQLITIISAQLMAFSGYALIVPFFPQIASKKGMTEFETGMVFSSFQIVTFFMNPVYGMLIMKFKPRLMCIMGACICGMCCASFGLLIYLEGIAFKISCYLVRFIEGNGSAMLQVAGTSLLMNSFPESTGTVTCLIEASFGLGLIAGPAIGSALYSAGGYILPFISVGAVTISFAVVMMLLLKNEGDVDIHSKNFFQLLLIPGEVVIYMYSCMNCVALTFLDPVISNWLCDNFSPHITITNVGFLFAGWSAFYAFANIPVGRIADKGFVFTPLIIGVFGCGVAYFCLVPSPLLAPLFPHGKQVLAGVLVALFGFFCFCSFSTAPTYLASLNLALLRGYRANLNTYGLVSGLVLSSQSLGSLIGPMLSGYLTGRCGLPWATTIVGFALFTMGLILVSYISIMRLLGKPLSPQSMEDINESTRNPQNP